MASYKIAEILLRRWKVTKIMNEIETYKKIHIETKNGKEFDSLLDGFYKCIDQSNENDICNGALLIAVIRGRASEGLDFKSKIFYYILN